jgi:hypothetical protein
MATPTWRRQDGDAKMATPRWRFSLMSQTGCERVDGRRRNDSEQSARFAFSPRKQAGLRAGPLAARPGDDGLGPGRSARFAVNFAGLYTGP